jgi:hypothetical protein
MGLFHLWLIMTNRSTLDLHVTERYNVFDTGSWQQNCWQICGMSWVTWFIPVHYNTIGNGIFYPLRVRNKQGGVCFYDEKILV